MTTDDKRKNIIMRLVATAEAMGGTLTQPAAEIMYEQVEGYTEAEIVGALKKAARNRGRFTVAMLTDQLASLDGRPTVDEAWAKIPRDESSSVAMTEEMAKAWGIAQPLLEARDNFGARKAFEAAYNAAVDDARDEGRPVSWFPSLGDSQSGREAVQAEVRALNQQAMARLADSSQRALGRG